MERTVIEEIGRRDNGSLIKRILLINDDKTNYLTKAQSYFTRDQKKAAKLSYKNSKNI